MTESAQAVRLAAMLREELAQVGRVVDEAAQVDSRPGAEPPPPLALRGAAGIVHDFYTGLEHAFERVAAEIDGGVPEGATWHRALLQAMTLELPTLRPAVLRRATAHRLDAYLRFRHLFRNVYGFDLEWSRLRPLIEELPACWAEVSADVGAFAAFLDEAGLATAE